MSPYPAPHLEIVLFHFPFPAFDNLFHVKLYFTSWSHHSPLLESIVNKLRSRRGHMCPLSLAPRDPTQWPLPWLSSWTTEQPHR